MITATFVCLLPTEQISMIYTICVFSLLVIEFVITSIILLIQLVRIQRAMTNSLILKDLMSSNTDSEIVSQVS